MSPVRSLLPTDLPALLAHAGLSLENAAYPRERLGAGETQATLSVLRDQLLTFARQRSAWVSMRRQRLQGLVGARQRGGSLAWEIDYLLDTTPDRSVAAAMLEYAVTQAGKEGAQKIFLRLPADSDLMPAVLEAGFLAYQEETLYARRPARGSAEKVAIELRPGVASDSYPLFRLYCQVTPESTRRFEAATFDEWHAAQERRWQKNGLHLIQERNGSPSGLIRACRLPHGIMLDLLLDSTSAADAAALVSAAVTTIEARDEIVFVLLPRAAEGVTRALEGAGFTAGNQYVSLVRRTTKPLALPRKVPVVAKNAVGV
jgi:hypothetical protein